MGWFTRSTNVSNAAYFSLAILTFLATLTLALLMLTLLC